MLDPFPLQLSANFEAIANKIGGILNLDTLAPHLHEVLLSFSFYHLICAYISPAVSRALLPNRYPKFDRRTKINWDVHVVSLVQSTIISGLALWVLWTDEERAAMDYKKRVWGYTGATGMIQALGCGYFLWDLWISLENLDVFGPGLLAHAGCAFWVFAMGFRPFTAPYAPVFILYELSSPFLNIHWALDKLDMTGSNTQLVNGIFLMSSFFGSRLVWGVWKSYCVFSDVFRAIAFQETPAGKAWLKATALAQPAAGAKAQELSAAAEVLRYVNGKEIPYWYAITYLGSNAILTLLNIYWFGQMIKTIRKRFEPPFGTKDVGKKNETIMGRGVDEDGVRSVEVASKEVRRRTRKDGLTDSSKEDPTAMPAA